MLCDVHEEPLLTPENATSQNSTSHSTGGGRWYLLALTCRTRLLIHTDRFASFLVQPRAASERDIASTENAWSLPIDLISSATQIHEERAREKAERA